MRTPLAAIQGFARSNLTVAFAGFCFGLAGILVFRVHFQHHSVWAPRYYSKCGVKLYGSFTPSTVARVDELLSVLPRRVVRAIDLINLNNDKKHYSRGTVGHFSQAGGRRICLRNDSINALWHEAGHAYESYLNSQDSNFTKEWISIAGNVYGCRDVGSITFPGNGLLNAYSSKNHKEDVAVFMEEFYLAVAGEPSDFRLLYAIRLGDFARGKPWQLDFRYQKKADLLLEYGFVNRADYDKFMGLGYLDFRSGSPLAHFVLPKPKDEGVRPGIFYYEYYEQDIRIN